MDERGITLHEVQPRYHYYLRIAKANGLCTAHPRAPSPPALSLSTRATLQYCAAHRSSVSADIVLLLLLDEDIVHTGLRSTGRSPVGDATLLDGPFKISLKGLFVSIAMARLMRDWRELSLKWCRE